MRVLVTGAAGQLGTEMVREFGRDHEVVARDVGDLDLTDHRLVAREVAAIRPGAVINCAAYTNVDGAEDEPVAALEVNALAVHSLAVATASIGATLVHYSTDFVFDGRASEPYTEADPPSPRSVYAASKLVGEWLAADAGRYYVLRVESLFGGGAEGPAGRRASVDRIIDALVEGREAPVFVDRTVSPSYIVDVARATRALLERDAPFGLYHCVSSGHCTWHELGEEIVRQLGVPSTLKRVLASTVTLKAERPLYAALSNRKLAEAAFVMPTWQDAIARYLKGRLGP